METIAILPVKSLGEAKQRLSEELPPEPRRLLARAMLADVLEALGRVGGLSGVLVVTEDDTARQIAADHGASVLGRPDHGHNDAARAGIDAALARGAERVLLVPGDCPLLDAGELEELVAAGPASASVLIVPDRHGTGTNALLLTPPGALGPSFGPGSCERHGRLAAAAGLEARVVPVPSLALDVDTGEDVTAVEATLASAPGRAANTRAALESLGRTAGAAGPRC